MSGFRDLHAGLNGVLIKHHSVRMMKRHIQRYHKPPIDVENRVSIFTAYIVGEMIMFLFDLWGTALSYVFKSQYCQQ